MKNTFALLTIILLLICSCQRTAKELTKAPKPSEEKLNDKPAKPTSKTIVNENFDAFYIRFHKDSIFQIKRVKFPLEGYAMDTSELAIHWNKQNWIMHRNTVQTVDTTIFKVETLTSPHQYSEKIYIEGGGFASERVFKQINSKWYLVKFIDEDL